MSEQPDANTVVSHEQDGRVLSGVGVSADDLSAVMDRHSPPDPTPSAPASEPVPGSTTAPVPATTQADSSQPKPTRGQARFSELTQQRKAAEERAAAAEKKAQELEARLAQPAATPPPVPEPARQQPAQQPVYTRPEPSEDDVGTKYQTYAEFTKDQAAWLWEQQQGAIQSSIRQGIEADRAAQAFTAHVESTRAKGRAAYKDFDQMLQSGPGTFVPMPQAAVEAILNAPHSEHVQYAIMRDGQLAQRLAQIAFQNPYAFAFELAKLAPPPAQAVPGNGHASPPPPPMQPVGSGSRTTTPPSAEHAKNGDYAAYKASRAAELGRGRR